MTLSPEVATLLRAALRESEAACLYGDAYSILATAVGNLLEPLPQAPDQGQPTDLFAAYQRSDDEKNLPW